MRKEEIFYMLQRFYVKRSVNICGERLWCRRNIQDDVNQTVELDKSTAVQRRNQSSSHEENILRKIIIACRKSLQVSFTM